MEPVQGLPRKDGRQIVLRAENVLMKDPNLANLGTRVVGQDSITRCAFQLSGQAVADRYAEKDKAEGETKENSVWSLQRFPLISPFRTGWVKRLLPLGKTRKERSGARGLWEGSSSESIGHKSHASPAGLKGFVPVQGFVGDSCRATL
jgi:hypothetical protein